MQDTIDLGYNDLFRSRDYIYRWVDEQYVVNGRIIDAHWPTSQWRDGLSCDWAVLSGVDETARRRAGSLPAHVLRFSIQDCQDLQIRIRHCPVIAESSPDYNLAHCLLVPPDSGKAAIRNLREELQKRATLLPIREGSWHPFFAVLRRMHPRYKAAIKHIRDLIEKTESA